MSIRAAPRRDPAAGAVGGGAAAVQRGRELPGDERSAVVHGERPDPVDGARLVLEQAALDLDARVAQGGRTPGRDRVGVALRVDHAAYAGLDQRLRARSGAAGVVARLQRDDRRGAAGAVAGAPERVDLGVRGPGAAVPALGEHLAVRAEQHAADPRVGAGGHAGRRRQGERAPHRGLLAVLVVILASGRVTDPGACGPARDTAVGGATHPTLVLLPIRTLTVGPGVPPGQPAAGCRRVADFHRRLGFSPTPEHVSMDALALPVWHRVASRSPRRSPHGFESFAFGVGVAHGGADARPAPEPGGLACPPRNVPLPSVPPRSP